MTSFTVYSGGTAPAVAAVPPAFAYTLSASLSISFSTTTRVRDPVLSVIGICKATVSSRSTSESLLWFIQKMHLQEAQSKSSPCSDTPDSILVPRRWKQKENFSFLHCGSCKPSANVPRGTGGNNPDDSANRVLWDRARSFPRFVFIFVTSAANPVHDHFLSLFSYLLQVPHTLYTNLLLLGLRKGLKWDRANTKSWQRRGSMGRDVAEGLQLLW